MGKRIESSNTGYLFAGYIAEEGCRLKWSEFGVIRTPDALEELYRRRESCATDGKHLSQHKPIPWGWRKEDFRPRKVRVTLTVEDITDGEEQA